MGPFKDDTDAKTNETALTIQKADVRLSKNGGDYAAAHSDQGASDAGAAHDELGDYDITLDTTDTNTLGDLRIAIEKSGALRVTREFTVLPANVFDSLIAGSDYLQVSISSPSLAKIGLVLDAEIATVTSQTVFTLSTGSDQNDAYNQHEIILYDDSNNDYTCKRTVLDYVGASKTVTIDSAPNFTLGADDSIRIFAVSSNRLSIVV
jgi:hypothetical protein